MRWILLILVGLIFMGVNLLPFSSANSVYTIPDLYNCSGSYYPAYPCANSVDGNWDTAAYCGTFNCHVYTNYSNFTIPDNYISVYSELEFSNIPSDPANAYVNVSCFNSTSDWQYVYNIFPLNYNSTLEVLLPASCYVGVSIISLHIEFGSFSMAEAHFHESKVVFVTPSRTPFVLEPSGGGISASLKSWNPETYEELIDSVKVFFNNNSPPDFFFNLQNVAVLFLQYMFKQPASMVRGLE